MRFRIIIVGLLVLSVTALAPPAKLSFDELGEYLRYQKLLCPCKTDWQLASNERELSNYFGKQADDEDIPDPRGLSNLAWAWGQFIAHDITRQDTDPNSTIYHIDNFTLTRVKSFLAYDDSGCRESDNHISPRIDAGTIYGDSFNSDLGLRETAESCRLRTSQGNLLPVNEAGTEFVSGDIRNSENSLLTTLHTLFMREHNRLCGILEERVPGWSENERFWKARDIVMSKIQRITFEEWLPALLGSQMYLVHEDPPRFPDEKTTVISSEFANVAYRLGHSMVSNTLGPFSLWQMFFNISLIQEHGIEPFLQAGATEHAQKSDIKFVNGLRNILFGKEDLFMRNLFRARELTLANYTQMALCYGETPIDIPAIKEDPLIGLLTEELVPGSSLGRTIAVIVAEQFQRLWKYDPDFFRKDLGKLGSFRYEVETASLSKVIALNTPLKLQQNVFFK